ncbi:hypothetical protein [Caenimonas koreensis]
MEVNNLDIDPPPNERDVEADKQAAFAEALRAYTTAVNKLHW